jgi:hypothetical protein
MINITHLTFDPKAVSCIIRAYDAAWDSLRGSIFASAGREEETRATLVRSIIATAERGERDPVQLRDEALRCFGMR